MARTTGFGQTEMTVATEFKSCSVPREQRQKFLKEGPHSAGVCNLFFFPPWSFFSSTWEPLAPVLFFALFWDSCSSNLNPNTPKS